MKGDGMEPEVLDEFHEVARKAAGVVEITTVKDIEGKEDCEEHLKRRCTKKDCKTLRQRKNCKYFSSEERWYRGTVASICIQK